MDDFILELCAKNQLTETSKILSEKTRKRGALQKLDNFILFKKAKMKDTKSTNKLSFEVNQYY